MLMCNILTNLFELIFLLVPEKTENLDDERPWEKNKLLVDCNN